MSRKMVASVLFALALFAMAGFARQPGKAVPNPNKSQPKDSPKAGDPLDALIGAALQNDADVELAQAKLRLAEVEVVRARQHVSQKVVALDSAIKEQRKLVVTAEQMFKIAEQIHARGQGSFAEMLQAREKLEMAQAKLAVSETELKSITGGGAARVGFKVALADPHHAPGVAAQKCTACHAVQNDANDLAAHLNKVLIRRWEAAVQGPVADRIRSALDKPVKLGPKDAKVTFAQALEVFKKDAALDVPIRVDIKVDPITSLGEELPVGAWLQLFGDGTTDARFLVREYGLLVTSKDLMPPDAMSVHDFWKQPAEKKLKTP